MVNHGESMVFCGGRYDASMNVELRFGEWIEDTYTRMGMTQDEFAELANVSQSAVSTWVLGQALPRVRSVPDVAAALGVRATEVHDRIKAERARIKREEDERRTYGRITAPSPDSDLGEEARIYASIREGLHALDLTENDIAAALRLIDLAIADKRRHDESQKR